MGELDNKFDAIDARKDGKQDVGADFEAKKEAQRAFYHFAIKDAQGQIDMRHPSNIQLMKEITTLLEKQDLECFAVTQYIENQMQTIKLGARQELSQEQEQVEVQKLANYFSIAPEKLQELRKNLKEGGLNLDVLQLLEKYKKYIDEHLVGLDPKYLLKVKQSIGLRTLSIGKIVGDLKKKESDMSQFQNNKWIINEKVTDHFERVDKAILPSCVFYIKYSQKAQADEFVKEYNRKNPSLFRADDALRGQNMELWLSETKKVLESPLDEEGNFKFTWFGFGTQIILDERRADSESFLQEAQIPKVEETNILSEEDREIERKAKLYFIAAVGVHIGLGSATWLAGPAVGTGGTLVSAGIDAADLFSSTEVLMDILQGVGLVDPRYRMEKTLFDNFMAGLGIIPGISIAVKQQKIAKFLSKFTKSEVSKAMGETAEALKDWLKGSTHLGYTTQDIKRYTSLPIEDMLKISSKEERLKAAEIVLGQKLSQQQKDVIWEAHSVGKAPFSFSDIKEKIRILTRDKIFKENERKRLLQRGVCGEKGDPYKEFPYISKFRDKIIEDRNGKDIEADDILGYGDNGVIIKSGEPGYVLKVAKTETGEKLLVDEHLKHKAVLEVYQDAPESVFDKNVIKIPSLRHQREEGRLYSMEKLDGNSVHTLRLKAKYKDLFFGRNSSLTDNEIKSIVKKAAEEGQSVNNGTLKVSITDVEPKMYQEYFSFPMKKTIREELGGAGGMENKYVELRKVIEYLQAHGVDPGDFHGENVMISRDGKVLYIIDFGGVVLK